MRIYAALIARGEHTGLNDFELGLSLLQGRINKFSLDALVKLAVNAGLQVSIQTRAA